MHVAFENLNYNIEFEEKQYTVENIYIYIY